MLLLLRDPWMRLVYVGLCSVGVGAAFMLARRGKLQAGSVVLVLALAASVTGGVLAVGNIYTPSIVGYPIVVIAAGLLLGTRSAIVSALVCVSILALLGQHQDPDSLQAMLATHTPSSIWWIQTSALAAAAALICVAVGRTRSALEEAEASELALAERNSELEREVATRRQVQSELLESERRFRALVQHSDDIISEIEVDGGVVYANPSFEVTFGLQPEALSQRSIVHPEDRRLAGDFLRRLAADRVSVSAPIRLQVADGSWRWFEATAACFSVGEGVDRAVSVCRDVTKRKVDADRLRESEARFRALAENAHEVIAEFDSMGKLIFVSPNVETLTGFSREKLLRSDPFEQLHPEDLKMLWRKVERIFDAPHRLVSLELRYKHASGSWRRIEASVQSFDTSFGTQSVVVVARDITERLELERQLRASQKLEAVARLAGGVAHDFNNLLTVVTGHVELLLDREVIADDERESLAQVQYTALRARELIEQLFAFSRTPSGESRILDANEVVRDVERLLSRVIGEQADLEVRTSRQALPVRFVRSHLEQIITNLSLNARDALRGEGRIVIEARDADPARGDRAESVVLSVSDTGTGMDEETRDHIFEPFFTTKAPGEGTGLGLSIVNGMVESAGGSIDVDTALGAGSCFTISLPRSPEPYEAVPVERCEEAVEEGRTGQTILVVEDETPVRRLVQRVLSRKGFRLLEARDGKEALEVARSHLGSIDLLLSDVIMPVMGGVELARHLESEFPGLRTLFMTGYREDVSFPGSVGVQKDALLKPFGPDELMRRVRAALESP